MTIVGSERMIVYDEAALGEKSRYSTSVEGRPRTTTPLPSSTMPTTTATSTVLTSSRTSQLKSECQHFVDCIRTGKTPLTDGARGLDIVRILRSLQRLR